jgi:hypothetical protein
VTVVLLCGELGGARLAPFLAARNQLTAICNVADDLETAFVGTGLIMLCPPLA